MRSRRVEERNLRSLDRAGLRKVFTPLDVNERPSRRRGGRNILPGQMFTSAFTREDPSWKDGMGLLFLPLLAGLISVLLWMGVPQPIGWLVVGAYVVAFSVAAVVVYRRA